MQRAFLTPAILHCARFIPTPRGPRRSFDIRCWQGLQAARFPLTGPSSRFDRCNRSEKRYMRALAELGPGHHKSGAIADQLGLKVTSVGPTRSKLITKGMIYSHQHGDTAFTVPLFDAFMKRVTAR